MWLVNIIVIGLISSDLTLDLKILVIWLPQTVRYFSLYLLIFSFLLFNVYRDFSINKYSVVVQNAMDCKCFNLIKDTT